MEYRIGDFSLIARLSVKTLRFYHECGLLEPDRIDRFTGYRYYGEASLERARTIAKLRDLEFSIAEIREILAGANEDESIAVYAARKAKEIADKLQHYRRIEEELSYFVQTGTREKDMIKDGEITIKTIGEVDAATIRFRGSYGGIGRRITELYRCAGRLAAGGPFSLYYDTEYKDEDADIEVCVPLKPGAVPDAMPKEVTVRGIPGFEAVTTVYRGPYERIGDGYRFLADYLNGRKVEAVAPYREVYLKGPGFIFRGNQRNYLTELQVGFGGGDGQG
jgi:DNA-binding transcriptional MerR regulator